MNNPLVAASALTAAALLCACSPSQPAVLAPRPVRTVELHYDNARESNRYVGTVQSRYEVDQAFRVGGKVVQRKVDVGQSVQEGDVLAVLDDSDYRLAEEASQRAWEASVAQARQADSDRQRLSALKADGSVSAADDERARTSARTAQSNAEAEARQLELARNRLKYTVLRASRSGVVTTVRFEVGQVVAEGTPVISIADPSLPEIVVDVPEDRLVTFQQSSFQAALTSLPGKTFAVALRELAPQASAQTRTYRARLKPLDMQQLPLGATATLEAARVMAGTLVAAVPATALTQSSGQPAVWVVKPTGGDALGTVERVPVAVWGYRNEEVLVSGPPAGERVVTAGVQKMSPGLKVALASDGAEDKAVVAR
ncbi:efflux RND transporter periplasmic adaptor subunit [Pseudomonas sp. LA21]|uniref:efflux RND transporter periplasmic adaptor subunit n=1 Tax=unclassified Pseudomonas TaxID=196821 RepID=UPI001FB636DA|nr:efflux RND transporter periplasmic adaptor subunit [Pseudomonas sp. LA21]MCJ1886447.1 efflux RND transporter periplasmic adaptor subunit [Pseudomonas sp. LA21]